MPAHRRRDGRRSTFGVCTGALSWVVRDGHAGDVDLTGLAAVLVCRYDDDEPGSPWTYRLYVDDRGDEDQREALAAILTGKLGGRRRSSARGLEAGERARLEAGADRGRPRAGARLVPGEGRRDGPGARGLPDQDAVTCVIPGHDRTGREVICDELRVQDGPLCFELTSRCGYESTFDYRSA